MCDVESLWDQGQTERRSKSTAVGTRSDLCRDSVTSVQRRQRTGVEEAAGCLATWG